MIAISVSVKQWIFSRSQHDKVFDCAEKFCDKCDMNENKNVFYQK